MKSKTKEYRSKYWREYRKKKFPYIQKICSVCKKPFKQTGNSQVRCEKCSYLICSFCNKKFKPNDSRWTEKFCSKKCYAKSLKGKIPVNLKGKRVECHKKTPTYGIRAKYF